VASTDVAGRKQTLVDMFPADLRDVFTLEEAALARYGAPEHSQRQQA
jgi:hypothetical protein